MDGQVFALVLVLLLLVGCVYWIWKLNGPTSAPSLQKPKVRKVENLDTLVSWSPEPSRILTFHERQAYQVLKEAVPELMLLAQVPLARFLRVPTRNSYSEWLRRVGQLCADIVVCDETSMAVAVIEIRAPLGKESERGLRRHERMDRVLKAAGIAVIVWREGAIPDAEAARRAVMGEQTDMATREGASHVNTDSGLRHVETPLPDMPALSIPIHGLGVGATPVPVELSKPAFEPQPVLHDVVEDEAMERREPPPSTWFDDLDSTPLPLDQKA